MLLFKPKMECLEPKFLQKIAVFLNFTTVKAQILPTLIKKYGVYGQNAFAFVLEYAFLSNDRRKLIKVL